MTSSASAELERSREAGRERAVDQRVRRPHSREVIAGHVGRHRAKDRETDRSAHLLAHIQHGGREARLVPGRAGDGHHGGWEEDEPEPD